MLQWHFGVHCEIVALFPIFSCLYIKLKKFKGFIIYRFLKAQLQVNESLKSCIFSWSMSDGFEHIAELANSHMLQLAIEGAQQCMVFSDRDLPIQKHCFVDSCHQLYENLVAGNLNRCCEPLQQQFSSKISHVQFLFSLTQN